MAWGWLGNGLGVGLGMAWMPCGTVGSVATCSGAVLKVMHMLLVGSVMSCCCCCCCCDACTQGAVINPMCRGQPAWRSLMLSHALVAVAHDMHTTVLVPQGFNRLSITVPTLDLAALTHAKHHLARCSSRQKCATVGYRRTEKKRKEKVTPFGVNLTRILVMYQAAQM